MHLTILNFFSETIQTGCQQPLLLTSILPPPPPPHRQPGKGNKISKGVFILSKVANMYLIESFFEARAEIQKYFRWFFGSNENFKICFRD